MPPNPIFFVGLDSANPSLIEAWMEDGSLPTLKRLRERGAYTRVNHPGDQHLEIPWATFYTGQNPGTHGVYHYIQWNSKKAAYERINSDQLGLQMQPFWREFHDGDPRAIVIDILHLPDIQPFNGIEINGYVTYESLQGRYYYPPEMKKLIDQNVGIPPEMWEKYELYTIKELTEIHGKLLTQNQDMAKLVNYLQASQDWDLFITLLASPHRSGHRFMDTSNLRYEEEGKDTSAIENALKEVYQSCDRAIADMIAELPPNTTILVSSLHAMDFNHSRTHMLPKLLERVIGGPSAPSQPTTKRRSPIHKLREMVPNSWRWAVKIKLPLAWQDRMTNYWYTGKIDWENTPAFTVMGDYFGHVQINLKGREKYGWVSPGEEYQAWIERIKAGLSTFKDGDTGEDIIERIFEKEESDYHGERMHLLPDLSIEWKKTPTYQHRSLVSDVYGEVPWPTPNRDPNGRSGHHRNQGFLIAVGEQFPPNSLIPVLRTIDFAPTILDLLGLETPDKMEGKSILHR
ncbi:MAG: alkaline phosphatase family protein [Anaerolineae bacterium]|nr:alkaline phosphatase family protein [Anaerolineae bacterium]